MLGVRTTNSTTVFDAGKIRFRHREWVEHTRFRKLDKKTKVLMSPYVLLGVGYTTNETFALPNCILRNQLMRSCVSSICVFFFTVVVIKFHAHPIKGQRPHTELRLCVHSPLCEWILFCFVFFYLYFFFISLVVFHMNYWFGSNAK